MSSVQFGIFITLLLCLSSLFTLLCIDIFTSIGQRALIVLDLLVLLGDLILQLGYLKVQLVNFVSGFLINFLSLTAFLIRHIDLRLLLSLSLK